MVRVVVDDSRDARVSPRGVQMGADACAEKRRRVNMRRLVSTGKPPGVISRGPETSARGAPRPPASGLC